MSVRLRGREGSEQLRYKSLLLGLCWLTERLSVYREGRSTRLSIVRTFKADCKMIPFIGVRKNTELRTLQELQSTGCSRSHIFQRSSVSRMQHVCVGTLVVGTELDASSRPVWRLPCRLSCSKGEGVCNGGSQFSVGFTSDAVPQAVVRCDLVGTAWRPWQCAEPRPASSRNTRCHLLRAQLASQMAAEPMWSRDPPFKPRCRFHAPRHSVRNAPQWNNCLYLPLSTWHKIQLIMRKCDLGCRLVVALSHVHFHTGLSSHLKSCQVIK